jgi:hypothetical protein
MAKVSKAIKAHKYWPHTASATPWTPTSPQSNHEIRYCLYRIYHDLHCLWISTCAQCPRKCGCRGMLAKLCIQRWLTLHFIIDSTRHVQVPPKLAVTLVMPSLSCEHTAQDKSTTSTRLALQNFRTLLLILDITMKAPPAISSLTNNPTPSLSTDYTMVQ